VAKFIYQIMLKFGAPDEIVSDRASCFMARTLQDYLAIQESSHMPSTPYHPQTNGMVERMHGTMGSLITKLAEGSDEKWDDFVAPAVFILNARTHSVTGYSPFFLVYGIEPRLPGDIFPPGIYNTRDPAEVELMTHRDLTRLGQHRALALKRSQQNAAAYAARHPEGTGPTFIVGEYVKLKNFTKTKFQFNWKGPYIVDGIGSNNFYYLMRPDGTKLKPPYNGCHLAPWVTSPRPLS
jgi:hypothetical protein